MVLMNESRLSIKTKERETRAVANNESCN